MSTMTMARPVDWHRDARPAHRPRTGVAGGVAFASAVLVLLAMLPALAGGGAPSPLTAPGPLPAPAPAVVADQVVASDR
jgi:hypothetical protein